LAHHLLLQAKLRLGDKFSFLECGIHVGAETAFAMRRLTRSSGKHAVDGAPVSEENRVRLLAALMRG